jgi:putative transposase
VPGGTFFFTLVTYGRARFLCDERARVILRDCLEQCRREHPFAVEAMVLLPDHLHTIWSMPEGDSDFSMRFSVLKRQFTKRWIQSGGWEGSISVSRQRNRRRGVWQRRFWEHVIRDPDDLNRHLNYIHYNPVKHGLASCPHAWPYSSFGRWVMKRAYAEDWCCCCGSRETMPPDCEGLDELAME